MLLAIGRNHYYTIGPSKMGSFVDVTVHRERGLGDHRDADRRMDQWLTFPYD